MSENKNSNHKSPATDGAGAGDLEGTANHHDNDINNKGVEKAEENQIAMKMQQSRSRWKLASLVLMSLSLVTIVSCLVSWFLGGSGHHERYLILLDAGSVHTSVYTYRYSYNELANNVTVTETYSCELGQTGISSFRDNPVMAAEWLAHSECVTQSVARIPPELRPWSMIELCSTAGMRVIRLTHPEVADQILANLTQQLTQVGGGMTASARILSGQEEAVRGWITAWKLSERLVGALDWGGASAQITVPHGDQSGDQSDNTDHVSAEDSVQGRSNLCYGQQEAMNRHRAALVYTQYRHGNIDLDTDTVYHVSDSCLPAQAVTAAVPIRQLFSSPCTKLLNSTFMSAIQTSNVTVSFVSSYDYDTCSRLVQSQFRPSTCLSTWQPMRGEHTCLDPAEISPPSPNLTYLAMSTYYYIPHHLNLSQPFTMDQFLHTSADICSLEARHPRLRLLKKVKADTSACFQTLLMYHLLTSGYHFTEQSWNQLKFVKRINDAEVGWGLGHAVLHANSLLGQQHISVDAMVMLLSVSGLLLLLSVLAAYKGRCGLKMYSTLSET